MIFAIQFKGFKSFTFAKVDKKVLDKVISKSLGVKQNIIDILSDYHKTHEELFEELDIEKFDAKEYLGE